MTDDTSGSPTTAVPTRDGRDGAAQARASTTRRRRTTSRPSPRRRRKGHPGAMVAQAAIAEARKQQRQQAGAAPPLAGARPIGRVPRLGAGEPRRRNMGGRYERNPGRIVELTVGGSQDVLDLRWKDEIAHVICVTLVGPPAVSAGVANAVVVRGVRSVGRGRGGGGGRDRLRHRRRRVHAAGELDPDHRRVRGQLRRGASRPSRSASARSRPSAAAPGRRKLTRTRFVGAIDRSGGDRRRSRCRRSRKARARARRRPGDARPAARLLQRPGGADAALLGRGPGRRRRRRSSTSRPTSRRSC